MQPKAPFESYTEYLINLLILLDEKGETRLSEAVQTFESKFGAFIPPKDRALMSSGKPRWAYLLEWGRYDLNQLDLMTTPARGIWTLSDEGRTWLKNHSEYDSAIRSMDTMLREKSRAWRGTIKKDKYYTFRWHDQEIHCDADKLEQSALDEIRLQNPSEAFRFRDWYALLDDKKVSVKWLFHLLTGAGYDEFVTYQAVAVLRKLGFNIQKNSEKAQMQPKPNQDENQQDSAISYDLQGDEFEHFLEEIRMTLPHRLPDIASYAKINASTNLKIIQVSFPDINYAHYEILFRRADEIAFHFECQLAGLNLERLKQSKPFIEGWSNELGAPIQAELWGKKKARIAIRLSEIDKFIFAELSLKEILSLNNQFQEGENFFISNIKEYARKNPDLPFWKMKADIYTSMLARFIQVTFPDLQRMFGGQKRHSASSITNGVSEYNQDSRSHHKLDQKINEIRDFLAGRFVRTPEPEELCDWIQLCYLFELSYEGQKLFQFVHPQILNNDWLYRRTKKYADVCRLKAPIKG